MRTLISGWIEEGDPEAGNQALLALGSKPEGKNVRPPVLTERELWVSALPCCLHNQFLLFGADFEGKVVKTSVVFNKLGTAMPLSMEEGPEFRDLW